MACCPKGKTAISTSLKYILLVGTLIHWMFGAVVVGIGVWAYVEKAKYFYQPIEDVYDVVFDLSVILIAAGSVLFAITICGFVGTLRENVCLLKLFYYPLALCFILEVVGGALAFIFSNKVISVVKSVLKKVYIQEYQYDVDAIMDYFQEHFACCGISTYVDWNLNDYFNCTNSNPSVLRCAVPYSCCKSPDALTEGLTNILCGSETLLSNSTTLYKIYTGGCLDATINTARDNLPIIGGVALAIAVPQVMGVVLGCIFAEQIHRQITNSDEDLDR